MEPTGHRELPEKRRKQEGPSGIESEKSIRKEGAGRSPNPKFCREEIHAGTSIQEIQSKGSNLDSWHKVDIQAMDQNALSL